MASTTLASAFTRPRSASVAADSRTRKRRGILFSDSFQVSSSAKETTPPSNDQLKDSVDWEAGKPYAVMSNGLWIGIENAGELRTSRSKTDMDPGKNYSLGETSLLSQTVVEGEFGDEMSVAGSIGRKSRRETGTPVASDTTLISFVSQDEELFGVATYPSPASLARLSPQNGGAWVSEEGGFEIWRRDPVHLARSPLNATCLSITTLQLGRTDPKPRTRLISTPAQTTASIPSPYSSDILQKRKFSGTDNATIRPSATASSFGGSIASFDAPSTSTAPCVWIPPSMVPFISTMGQISGLPAFLSIGVRPRSRTLDETALDREQDTLRASKINTFRHPPPQEPSAQPLSSIETPTDIGARRRGPRLFLARTTSATGSSVGGSFHSRLSVLPPVPTPDRESHFQMLVARDCPEEDLRRGALSPPPTPRKRRFFGRRTHSEQHFQHQAITSPPLSPSADGPGSTATIRGKLLGALKFGRSRRNTVADCRPIISAPIPRVSPAPSPREHLSIGQLS
ncbi:hypothetical protein DL93DRAFT_2170701 [Clavulina sp. PMI_390]|nr:hypothetical protein DL93DRAFT_2170701 [Clavulina sp. PMI_390]